MFVNPRQFEPASTVPKGIVVEVVVTGPESPDPLTAEPSLATEKESDGSTLTDAVTPDVNISAITLL